MPILIGVPMPSLFAQEGKIQETAEMFQVSRVGSHGAAETRELLGLIYKDVATKYDTKLREKAAKNNRGQEFNGERIRVIRRLAKSNPNGDLFLCAYAGRPSVVKITGVQLKGGELTPPLANIMAAGEHVTEITRTVVDPAAKKAPEPALQKVNKEGGGITFFGIPLDTGGGSIPAQEPPGTKQIKETKTLPMFTAEVSTEKLEEGPPPMSQQLFLSMVKNGEIFQYQQFEERRCQECRGFGRVTDTRSIGMRSPDGKMDCPDCIGTGKIKWDVTYMVGW
tara:strand:+ start:8272 stop:9111 length:840 start_codon:yes stop_codon:yes gene_type:complete